MSAAVVIFLLLAGTVFMFLAAVGVVRMPDLFMRMQTTTKATTLGIGCVMIAVAWYFGELAVALRAGAIVVFFYLTAPVAAHVIARAAYFDGTEVWSGTVVDELRGRYIEKTHQLRSKPPRPSGHSR